MNPNHSQAQSAIPPLLQITTEGQTGRFAHPMLPQPHVQQQSQQHPPTHNQHPSQHFSPHQQQQPSMLSQSYTSPNQQQFSSSSHYTHMHNSPNQQQYYIQLHQQQHNNFGRQNNSYRGESHHTPDSDLNIEESRSSSLQSPHFPSIHSTPASQSIDSTFLISPATTPLLSSLDVPIATDTTSTSTNTPKLSKRPTSQAPMSSASSSGKRTTKRGLPTSDTLSKAKKKRIIVEEEDDENDIEEQPSWLGDSDTDVVALNEGKQAQEVTTTKWMVKQLNKVEVFSVLQSRNQGMPRKTPKSEVYRTLAKAFNQRFPQSKKLYDQKSMKNKIENMKATFKQGHGLANKSGFGTKGSESWKKKIKEACFFYFELEPNWAVSWSDNVPEYCDSTSNLDDQFIVDVVPLRAAVDLTQGTDAGPNGEAATEEEVWPTDESDDDGEESQEQREHRWRQEEEDEEAQEDGRPGCVLQRPSQLRLKSKQNGSTPAAAAEGRMGTLKARNKSKGVAKPSGLSGGTGGKSDKMQALADTVRESLQDDRVARAESLELKKARFLLEKEAHQSRMALEERKIEAEIAERRERQANEHAFRMAQMAMQKEVEFRKLEIEAQLKQRDSARLSPSRNQDTPLPKSPSPQ
ncbi:hypothetical protein BGZ82_002671 [Podila clonocystis]|nr:hypothetical protein BGZ82_002671 [Podila clonocystis]